MYFLIWVKIILIELIDMQAPVLMMQRVTMFMQSTPKPYVNYQQL